MEKNVFIVLLIEAVVTLTPLATLFFKLGGWKKQIEEEIDSVKEDALSQRAETAELRISLTRMNDTLITISTKMDLLLAGKIKNEK